MEALVYHAKGGLANRLRAFVGYRTLAQRLNLPFLMHWELNGACGEEFHSLFERDGFEDLEFISAERMHAAAMAGAKVLSAGIWFSDIWRRHAADAFEQATFYRDAASALHSLRPVPSILERIEHFANAHALEECTGVHIRMTDNLRAYDWWAKNEPDFDPANVSQLEGFKRFLAASEQTGERVFLCTDNAAVSQDLLALRPNVFIYEKDYDERGLNHYLRRAKGELTIVDRMSRRLRRLVDGKRERERSWRTTPIADAVVDLFLLSRCANVVGTYYSSFAPVAALIGMRPMRVMRGVDAVEHEAVREMQGVLAGNSASDADVRSPPAGTGST